MLFQSVILWKIYNKDLEFETNYYADDLINIMFEGINPQGYEPKDNAYQINNKFIKQII